MLYSRKFGDEIMQGVNNFTNRINKLTIVSYDDKNMREMVSRYEELVPELRDYQVELNKESITKLTSMILLMMQYFDPAPAANTRIIKKYVSEEKVAKYATFLKGSFDEIKDSLEAAIPGLTAKLQEQFEENQMNEELQIKTKFAIIRAAQVKCMKDGKISMSKSIRDYLKTHTGENAFDLSEQDVETIKKSMAFVNKLFAWVCEHEKVILTEVAFYMSKEALLKETIEKKYPAPAPEIPEDATLSDIISASLKAYFESAKFKYTKAYDEYLEDQVKALIVILGGIQEDETSEQK